MLWQSRNRYFRHCASFLSIFLLIQAVVGLDTTVRFVWQQHPGNGTAGIPLEEQPALDLDYRNFGFPDDGDPFYDLNDGW